LTTRSVPAVSRAARSIDCAALPCGARAAGSVGASSAAAAAAAQAMSQMPPRKAVALKPPPPASDGRIYNLCRSDLFALEANDCDSWSLPLVRLFQATPALVVRASSHPANGHSDRGSRLAAWQNRPFGAVLTMPAAVGGAPDAGGPTGQRRGSPHDVRVLTAAAAGCACGPVLVRCACHAARGRRDRNSRAPREWRVRSAGSTTSRALLKQPDKQVIPKSCPDQPVSKTVPDTPPSDDTHRRTAMHRVSRKSRLAWLFRQAPGRPLEDLHGIVELLLACGADPIEADAELMCPLKRVLALPDLERPPHGYASARKSLSSVSCACLAARPTTT
jgi:hypothetical protein